MNDNPSPFAERAFVIGHSIAWTILLYTVFDLRNPALLALVLVFYLLVGHTAVRLRRRNTEHWDHRVRPWLITAGLVVMVAVAFLPRWWPS